MKKFESINDSLFQKLKENELSKVKGGDYLWHTWLTGRTKSQEDTWPEGCFQRDRMTDVTNPLTGTTYRAEVVYGDVICR